MPIQVEFEVKRITKIKGQGTLKAFCDVVMGEAVLIKGLKIVDGKNGLFVSMPAERGKDGKWYETVLPLTKETKEELTRIVLEAYQVEEESAATA